MHGEATTKQDFTAKLFVAKHSAIADRYVLMKDVLRRILDGQEVSNYDFPCVCGEDFRSIYAAVALSKLPIYIKTVQTEEAHCGDLEGGRAAQCYLDKRASQDTLSSPRRGRPPLFYKYTMRLMTVDEFKKYKVARNLNYGGRPKRL